ncbi:uncharacterized protein K452DRAFT_289730 [Aplosporella prunicola CBS 121167]|uniref:Uncharacterized protein n=1 Tax=Aplosporella prunicola CBS 121167 TaxID=1176127 RepID=A0A6A6B8Q9_9PEZI|nr:uncharacterized protein K452DRAFT_289730 [Aplosporella prunicola CBS 121167]KAF2139753.1 hypothetical protein K452DRAFT_289730 [Aplosporella prunicola CBS 121167]
MHRGVHLVGSVCLPSEEETFIHCSALLPGRLRRIPDGEPQHRRNFTMFQQSIFANAPVVLRKYDDKFNSLPAEPISAEEVDKVVKSLGELHTGYDDAAINSYQIFSNLRKQGKIDSHVKFQVSLPTPANVMCLIAEPFQAALEPVYERAILRDLERLTTEIPKHDLAVQWDVASEIAYLEEGAEWPHFKPYVANVKEHFVGAMHRLGNAVDPAVEMGFHLCYGDLGHRHFKEPKDLSLLVEIAGELFRGIHRRVQWLHMPVPKDREDAAYFAPLKQCHMLWGTELYLGVVHAHDEDGTRRRIKTASDVVGAFGVATECGMGRTPPEDFASIMQISAAVSQPIKN